MMNSIAAKLFNGARHLSKPGNWVKGTYTRDGAHCAIGEARRQKNSLTLVKFLYNALPVKYRQNYGRVMTTYAMQDVIINYNDRKGTRKKQIVNLFNKAGRLALRSKGDPNNLPITV